MIETINIAGRKSSHRQTHRKASESDYDCVFELDTKSGLYFGFINTNYNINSPKPLIEAELESFDKSNPDESLREILKEIDSKMVQRGYIARCVILIHKTGDEIVVAKAGGGIDAFAIYPPLFGMEDGFPVSVSAIVDRRYEAERDFFVGSGGCLPLVERLESDAVLAIMTNPMRTNIEVGFKGQIDEIIINKLGNSTTSTTLHNFANDIFEYIYMGKTSSHSSAYLAFI